VSDDEPIYQDALTVFLDLFEHQPPRQAELVIPAWAMRKLNALPEHERLKIMGEIDHIAAAHGLITPTKVIVAVPPQ
jgi:hypothetical protein